MQFYSWNINGYNTCNKYGGLEKIFESNPDFVCFQEVKISDPQELNTIFTYEYYMYHNFSLKKGHNGVFIYARTPAKSVITSINLKRFDDEGRFICIEYDEYFIINVYMPHGGRDKGDLPYKLEAYDSFLLFLNELKKKKSVIVMGDFNIAFSDLDIERYKSNVNNIMYTTEEKNCLKRMLEIGFRDVYRMLNSSRRSYTWWPYAFNARENNVGWRIDYFFVTEDLLERVKSLDIYKDIKGSDHCPIRLVLD